MADDMLLSVESVSVRHWRGDRSTLVLDDVSLELDAGEFGGVWAERSAGKTTLARVVTGLLPVDSGRVVFDGDDVASGRDGRRGVLHPTIGFASREGPRMAELAVGDWLASSLLTSCSWRDARVRAVVALDRFGASGLARGTWADLANSERTVVSLAHAMANAPRLLVVDDLAAGLGPLPRAELIAMLHDIVNSGVALLMTSVDLGDFRETERIWSLANGRLNGPPPRGLADVLPLRSEQSSRPA